MKQFEVPKLSEEEVAEMPEELREEHDRLLKDYEQQRAHYQKLLDEHDPYASGFRVLDTDYDDYLFVYHCLAKDEGLEAKLDGSGGEDEEAVERKELAQMV